MCAGENTTLSSATSGGSWSSSDEAKATINASTGVVTGVAAGSVTITYTVTNSCGSASTNFALEVQNCNTTIDLTLYIQGYYTGSGTMAPVLENQFVAGATSDQTDTITVSLYDEFDTSTPLTTAKAILKTDGTCSVEFIGGYIGNYWIGVKHRNALETWSSAAVAISNGASYNFASSASQAWLDNQTEVETGVWAFYSGDINQDGFIGVSDVGVTNNDNLDGLLFDYLTTDINGDGFVGVSDVGIVNNNNLAGVFFIVP